MKTNKFVFEISVDAVPHTSETVRGMLGSDYFNSDFGIQTHASELVFQVLRDSHIHCLMQVLKHLADCKCEIEDMNEAQKRYHDYLTKKQDISDKVMQSLRFSRMEKEA